MKLKDAVSPRDLTALNKIDTDTSVDNNNNNNNNNGYF